MTTYDPEVQPSAGQWLEVDESERIALVESYHQRARIRVPNLRLHSTLHVVVENQVALGETPVIETLERLRAEGLTRHDAVHAVGMVVAEQLYDLLQASPPASADPNVAYHDRLRRLTAAESRR